jgi:hypothetical protein
LATLSHERFCIGAESVGLHGDRRFDVSATASRHIATKFNALIDATGVVLFAMAFSRVFDPEIEIFGG